MAIRIRAAWNATLVAAATWVVAAGAGAWGVFVVARSLPVLQVEEMGRDVANGIRYQDRDLHAVDDALDRIDSDPFASAGALRSVAIVRSTEAERALLSGDRANSDDQLTRADAAVRTALRATPTDAYLWMLLFWLANTQSGFSTDHLDYLARSYEAGPREGWVAVRRNRLAFAVFERLTPALRAAALSEFSALVDAHLIDQAVGIFVGPAWPRRDLVLAALASTNVDARRRFAHAVYERGYRIAVPGVEQPEMRPWMPGCGRLAPGSFEDHCR